MHLPSLESSVPCRKRLKFFIGESSDHRHSNKKQLIYMIRTLCHVRSRLSPSPSTPPYVGLPAYTCVWRGGCHAAQP